MPNNEHVPALPDVIVAATPSRGHVSPMLQIAADLVARGHRVTVTTATAFAEQARRTGSEFQPLRGDADFDVEERTPGMRARPEAPEPGPAVVDYDMAWTFVEPIAAQHETLQALLTASDGRPTVVVHDNAFCGSWPVLLGASGVRTTADIGIGVTPITVTSSDTAPFGPGLPPDASEAGRARNRAMNDGVRAMLVSTNAALDRVLDRFGVRTSGLFFDDMVGLPDRFLELAPAAVEYPRSDLPATVRFVGALPAPVDDHAALPSWWPGLLAARERGARVVTVTQGTLSNYDLSELIEPTLQALSGDADDYNEVVVVAATGRDAGRLAQVPANAYVAEFVPFGKLLPVSDLLVSNGGYGSALQALGHGVPLVLAGISEDKVEVNARLAWTGAAIDLRTARPSVEALGEAITRALHDPGIRQQAVRIADEIAQLRPFDVIAEAVRGTTARS